MGKSLKVLFKSHFSKKFTPAKKNFFAQSNESFFLLFCCCWSGQKICKKIAEKFFFVVALHRLCHDKKISTEKSFRENLKESLIIFKKIGQRCFFKHSLAVLFLVTDHLQLNHILKELIYSCSIQKGRNEKISRSWMPSRDVAS